MRKIKQTALHKLLKHKLHTTIMLIKHSLHEEIIKEAKHKTTTTKKDKMIITTQTPRLFPSNNRNKI